METGICSARTATEPGICLPAKAPEKIATHQSVSRRNMTNYKTDPFWSGMAFALYFRENRGQHTHQDPVRCLGRFLTILVEIVEPLPVIYFRQIDTPPVRPTFSSIAPPQAAKGQAVPLRGDSPPDRDCSDRQIKTAKQPRREVVDRHARFAKRSQFAEWTSAFGVKADIGRT